MLEDICVTLVTLVARDVASDSTMHAPRRRRRASRCRDMRALPARATAAAAPACASIASLGRAGSIDGRDGDERVFASRRLPVRVIVAARCVGTTGTHAVHREGRTRRARPRTHGLGGLAPTGGVVPSEPSLSLMAYLSVFSVCLAAVAARGRAQEHRLLFFPMNALSNDLRELVRTAPSARRQSWACGESSAILAPVHAAPDGQRAMRSLRASRSSDDRLPPDPLVYEFPLSAPRSEPARSTSASLEGIP